jgi:hypothetical protein
MALRRYGSTPHRPDFRHWLHRHAGLDPAGVRPTSKRGECEIAFQQPKFHKRFQEDNSLERRGF